MKKFFIKVFCLIVNSLLVTLAFLYAVIWGSFMTVVALITTVCSNRSLSGLKLRLIMMWTRMVEAITGCITELQECDKEHYGI